MTYILCPGTIVSESDGDVHFISASDLARLYGVRMCECKVLDFVNSRNHTDIFLAPRSDGNYSLSKEIRCQQNKPRKAAAVQPAVVERGEQDPNT